MAKEIIINSGLSIKGDQMLKELSEQKTKLRVKEIHKPDTWSGYQELIGAVGTFKDWEFEENEKSMFYFFHSDNGIKLEIEGSKEEAKVFYFCDVVLEVIENE